MDFAEIDAGGGPKTGIQLGVPLPSVFSSMMIVAPCFDAKRSACPQPLCQVEELQHQLAHQCSPNIIGIWEWGICGLMGEAFIT